VAERADSGHDPSVVPERLRLTWIALVIASLAVVGSGSLIVVRFARHVFVECRGSLVTVKPQSWSIDTAKLVRTRPAETLLEIEWDEDPKLGPQHVRVVWNHPDSACACSDVRIPWDRYSYSSPGSLAIYRNTTDDTYVVRDPAGSRELAIFHRLDERGRRFQSSNVIDPRNVSMLVFLLSLGALALAASRAIRATPYATRMFRWTPATLREDGLVEGETGASLGKMDPRSRILAGDVIVDPAALEGHDVYRGLPILTRRTVGIGSHGRWYDGTMRRLRDARTLAILTTVTTLVALLAHVMFG
jgi:hypothetical protein